MKDTNHFDAVLLYVSEAVVAFALFTVAAVFVAHEGTKAAVIDHEVDVDVVASSDSLPKKGVMASWDREEAIEDMAYTMWCEASGEGRAGMLAVGEVIRNRVKSDLFPNDWYVVIHTPRQFSCWGQDGFTPVRKPERGDDSYRLALRLAKSVYEGRAPRMTANALFYHAKDVAPYWSRHYPRLGRIGNHVFYAANRL